ncbi:CBS domain [Carpediemonas membranifera]|uniref:CBS domain n=1 Tax=Carpediemonas membranifera TaxID=201153 RepID=A0A8J6EBG9_9EUKA|nr:CBS domain [Carpediemonas membranifera]|eukprot:KAG9397165.1 CBS domain [Carpediemonas membranifera]
MTEDNNQSETIADFFKTSTCYDMMPDSGRVIVVDNTMSLYRIWRTLADNSVTHALVWDAILMKYTGIWTGKDIMSSFLMVYDHFVRDKPQSSHIFHYLDNIILKDWMHQYDSGRGLLFVRPEMSLSETTQILLENDIHRIPVMKQSSDAESLIFTVTFSRLIRHLVSRFRLPSQVLDTPVNELEGFYVDENCPTVRGSTLVLDAVRILTDRHISAIPIVDDDDHVISLISKNDFIRLSRALPSTLGDMGTVKLEDVLVVQAEDTRMICRPPSVLFGEVIKLVAEQHLTRVIIVDDAGKLKFVISLRHILGYLTRSTFAANEDVPME